LRTRQPTGIQNDAMYAYRTNIKRSKLNVQRLKSVVVYSLSP